MLYGEFGKGERRVLCPQAWNRIDMESYRHLKKLLYVFETLMGVLFLVLSNSLFQQATLSTWLAAVVLFVTGSVCCVFGITTFRLREDPDIWR